jgi:hypothetical protein
MGFRMPPNEIDRIVEKLVKDVESAVHSLYRGEMRQSTAKARTDHLVNDARVAILAAATGSAQSATPAAASTATPRLSGPRPSVSAPTHAGGALGWTTEDSDAVLKCIMSWLPLSGPSTTAPDSKCIAAGKMLIPTWGERERAREAVRRITDD